MTTPDFTTIHPNMIDLAQTAWDEGDGVAIMLLVGHEKRGKLLASNIGPFRERGIYEAALFLSYIHGPHLIPRDWNWLFAQADKAKLQACGNAIPTTPIVVYRGVTDFKHRRFIRGLSWTTNPNTAAWFATRWPTSGASPAVYSILAKPEHILFVTNDRSEDEVVVEIGACGHVKRLPKIPNPIKPGLDSP